jgi:indole-3-glycerol phosphate synthase
MILDDIMADVRLELEKRKQKVPLEEIRRSALKQRAALDFASALRGDGVRLIAEVKKASPSRGLIRADFRPVEIARIYATGGAAAISVLTEPNFFRGNLDYLRDIKNALGNKVPLLRKDFINDPYQVYEARAYSADAILLIAAMLDRDELEKLLSLSHELGMKCLVEVHNEAELEIALESGAKIIGINNRDLYTFKVDIDTTRRLKPLIPDDRTVVSESGIRDRADIEKLEKWGINAVLIGEALMAADDIAARMRELL